MTRVEHQHQVALFRWASLMAREYPELRLMYAIPNGGGRSKAEAGRLKAEGVKPGMPDVCLPAPRGAFGACYIELKRPAAPGQAKGRVSPEQRAVLAELEAAGNRVGVAVGWEEAKAILMEYLQCDANAASAP
jgi:hypothetical protein